VRLQLLQNHCNACTRDLNATIINDPLLAQASSSVVQIGDQRPFS
jgi:hypothetical protein